MNGTKERCRPRNVLEEFDRDLNQFVREVLSPQANTASVTPVTFIELEDRYRVECELPGVELENISLSVEDSILSISGKRNGSELPESAKVMVNERLSREFFRSVRLPQTAQVTNMDAELKNGVLAVTILKRCEVLPRKIQIRRGGSES